MAIFELDRDEDIILHASNVSRDGYDESEFEDEELHKLFLTNKNIVYIVSDINSEDDDVIKVPLSAICIIGGKPQVEEISHEVYGRCLQVQFRHGVEYWRFGKKGKTLIPQWKYAITATILNVPIQYQDPIVEPETRASRSTSEAVKRESVYEGKLHKCPNCGEILNAFVPACPSCGYEIRDAKAVSSVQELSRKLEKIEEGRESKQGKLFKAHFAGKEITKTDEQKISLIRSFAIPNTKEDLYEFLILAGSNIDMELYDGSVQKTDARLEVSDAWRAKFEQAFQKAKIVFEGDPSFEKIQTIYESTQKNLKKAKAKPWKLIGIVYGILAVFLTIVIFILVPLSQNKEEKRLNEIIANIETALEDGEYKLALMYADSLVTKGGSEEFDQAWEIQREYWIDKVINEAAEDGVILEPPDNTDDLITSSQNETTSQSNDYFAGYMDDIEKAFDDFEESIAEVEGALNSIGQTEEGE